MITRRCLGRTQASARHVRFEVRTQTIGVWRFQLLSAMRAMGFPAFHPATVPPAARAVKSPAHQAAPRPIPALLLRSCGPGPLAAGGLARLTRLPGWQLSAVPSPRARSFCGARRAGSPRLDSPLLRRSPRCFERWFAADESRARPVSLARMRAVTCPTPRASAAPAFVRSCLPSVRLRLVKNATSFGAPRFRTFQLSGPSVSGGPAVHRQPAKRARRMSGSAPHRAPMPGSSAARATEPNRGARGPRQRSPHPPRRRSCASRRDPLAGKHCRKYGASHQLVVARRPSSRPARASTKVPVHAAATTVPARAHFNQQCAGLCYIRAAQIRRQR